jgi:hypothetical protein
MDDARPTFDNYFDVLQKAMRLNPWTSTEWVDKAQRFAVANIHAAFELVVKLSGAKDAGDAIEIQEEFAERQFNLLWDRLKAVGQIYTKGASEATKIATLNFSR